MKFTIVISAYGDKHNIYLNPLLKSINKFYSDCEIIIIGKNVPNENIPDSESLKDTFIRVTDYYRSEIAKYLKNENILISAHGNSLRALLKYLLKLDEIQISNLEIPTGNPLLIETEKGKIKNASYLDKERAKDLLVY